MFDVEIFWIIFGYACVCDLISELEQMKNNDAINLDLIVDLMSKWANDWQEFILSKGDVLTDEQIAQARCANVASPERVRVLTVPNVPMPHYRFWRETFLRDNLFDSNPNGLTLGYGVFLKLNCFPREYWLAHELIHVAQYERFGGLTNGLRAYLVETLNIGYANNYLEQEAHRIALECLRQQGIEFYF